MCVRRFHQGEGVSKLARLLCVKIEELYLWTLYVTVSHNLPCGILSFVGSLGIVHNIPTIICSLCSWRQRSSRMQVTQLTCCLLFDFIFVLSIKCFPTDPWSRSWCSQELRDQWVPSSQLTTWQASPFWHQVPAIWSWWLQLIIKVIFVTPTLSSIPYFCQLWQWHACWVTQRCFYTMIIFSPRCTQSQLQVARVWQM